MQQTILPLLSDCVIAFNLSQQKFIIISSCTGILMGDAQQAVAAEKDFWYKHIHPDDGRLAIQANNAVNETRGVETSYRIISPGIGRTHYINEKRSIYTDAVTGDKILQSILNEQAGNATTGNPADNEKDESLKREQFLHSLIDSQTNFLIRLDRNGCFTFVNKQYCKVFGYCEDELIGQHFSINTAPEDLERCQNAFITCINNPGKIIPLNRYKLNKNGSRHPTEWEFISVINETGEVSEIQGVGQDISQRIKIEEQVKQTADKLDSFIESITDSFFIVDTNWRFIKINTSLEKVSGKTRGEMMGHTLWEVFSPLLNTPFETNYRMALATQQTVKFTAYYEPLKLWFRTSVYPSAEGLTVFVRNITKQVLAEEELTFTRNNLETLINNTEDLIWSVTLDGRYIYTNQAFQKNVTEATGIPPFSGSPVGFDGYDNATAKLWQGYYQRAFNGERYTVSNEAVDPITGHSVCYEVSFNPIYKSNGQITGVGCFARDITLRLKTEREIMSQNDRLRQIASLSSHELRRPVASMLGLINIIDFEHFDNPENKVTIDYLLVVGKEIDQVIQQIVDNTFTGKSV